VRIGKVSTKIVGTLAATISTDQLSRCITLEHAVNILSNGEKKNSFFAGRRKYATGQTQMTHRLPTHAFFFNYDLSQMSRKQLSFVASFNYTNIEL